MRELDKVLDENERVFWEGNPKFWPFFLSGFAGILFGLVFLILGGIVLIQSIRSGDFLFVLCYSHRDTRLKF